jgi:enoyl-CoA hydratase/carnithine racemase
MTAESTDDRIRYEVTGGIACIKLAHPPVNAFDLAMVRGASHETASVMHLPRLIGRHRAFELLFTGRAFDAEQAAALGIVNRVVPDAELETETFELAAVLAAKPEAAMRAGRAAFMRQIDRDYRRRIAEAVEDFCEIAASKAAQARLRAFAAKRGPK